MHILTGVGERLNEVSGQISIKLVSVETESPLTNNGENVQLSAPFLSYVC